MKLAAIIHAMYIYTNHVQNYLTGRGWHSYLLESPAVLRSWVTGWQLGGCHAKSVYIRENVRVWRVCGYNFDFKGRKHTRLKILCGYGGYGQKIAFVSH